MKAMPVTVSSARQIVRSCSAHYLSTPSSLKQQLHTLPKMNINSTLKLNSGYEIPILGYGVYQTPAQDATDVVSYAMKVGYRHVDSAQAYRNEAPSAKGMIQAKLPREQIFYTTKIPPNSMNYDAAKKCIEESIAYINPPEQDGGDGGLGYIDLYLLHSPYGGKEGRLGAWKALVEGVNEGKIRSIGVSNYGTHHLDELEQYIKDTNSKNGLGSGGVLSVNQVELHPWLQRRDIGDWCRKRGVVLEAYSPLVRNQRPNDPLLQPLMKKHNKTAAQILVRWSLQKGFVPLPKSVTPSRIEENAAVFDFELSEEDMKSLETDDYSPCAWDPTVSQN